MGYGMGREVPLPPAELAVLRQDAFHQIGRNQAGQKSQTQVVGDPDRSAQLQGFSGHASAPCDWSRATCRLEFSK
jgi:hypothetical protein